MMDKDKLFQRPEPKEVNLPELDNVAVFVHALSGREYMAVLRQVREQKIEDEDHASALMMEVSVRYDSGEQFFDSGEALKLLENGSARTWLTLHQATQEQNTRTASGN